MNRNQELLSFEQTEQWGLHFSPSRWVINSVVKPVAIWTWERISATGVPDRWIVMSVLQSVANRVYRYAIEHCLSPMERLFCLPVGQHIACASRTEQDVTTSFTVLCRSATMNCSTASTKRLLHRLDETELVFIARYLVHVGRATIENNTVSPAMVHSSDESPFTFSLFELKTKKEDGGNSYRHPSVHQRTKY